MNFKASLNRLLNWLTFFQHRAQTILLSIFALLILISLGSSYYQQRQFATSEKIAQSFFELEAAHAQLQQSLLRLQNQFNPNFDGPVLLYYQLEERFQQLQSELSPYPSLAHSLHRIQQTLTQEQQWIKVLKSQMALYKNSYHYLPKAIHLCLAQVQRPETREILLQLPLVLNNPKIFKQTLNTLKSDPETQKCPQLLRHADILYTASAHIDHTLYEFTHNTLSATLQNTYQEYAQILQATKHANQRLFISLHFITLVLLFLVYGITQTLHRANRQLDETSQQLKKQRNLYRTLSELNQAIIREQEPEKLFQKATEIIQRYTGIPVSWVGKIDPETLTIEPIAASGITIETLKQYPITLTGQYNQTQVLADKVYAEKQRALVQDYEKEKKHSPFYPTLIKFGVRSMAIYHIHENNAVTHLLFLYSFEKNFFDPETDKLLKELIEDIELALHKHQLELKHQKAEEDLKIAAIAFESQEAIVITDAHEKIIRINRSFEQLYGYTETEVLGKSPDILRSDRHPPEFFQQMWQSLLNEGRWQGEIWNRTRSGKLVPVYETITAVNSLGRISHYIGHSADLSKEKDAQRQIEQLQHYDALTNLPNRKFLITQLEYFKHQQDLQGILIILNISDFKHFNDALGTQVGDLLLMTVAQRLNELFKNPKLQQLCEMDLVARTSADEFVIFAAIPAEKNILHKASMKLLTQLESLLDTPFVLGKETHKIHFYYGITLIPENEDAEPTEWLRQADIALHHAKKHPQHPIAFYQSQMQQEVEHLHHMEQALRQAIENDEFVMYYQPQVCLRTGRVVGAETLIRWQKPNGELVPPFQFIPILENSNLMVKAGYWIIDNILHNISQEPLIRDHQIQISINLSAQQFNDPLLDRNILHCLQQHQYPAELIELEVTESLLMENLTAIKTQLQNLQQNQVKIAIDDFGTGYSSFAYLREFAVNKIKIDKSFIDNITQTKDQAIVKAIIDMSQALGAIAIAEGVETDEQIHTLAKLDCDEIQGYYYSKPLPFDEFIDFIKRNSDNA